MNVCKVVKRIHMANCLSASFGTGASISGKTIQNCEAFRMAIEKRPDTSDSYEEDDK